MDVDSNGRVLVFREHWFASRGAIPEVPEVLLRDVTHIRTLLSHDSTGGGCVVVCN